MSRSFSAPLWHTLRSATCALSAPGVFRQRPWLVTRPSLGPSLFATISPAAAADWLAPRTKKKKKKKKKKKQEKKKKIKKKKKKKK
eukprot:NODE_27053_length_527_cov_3.730000.p3 GENE.NODE_27053_length_527_cov_3.730000~~NODE_27053_length_527_cov_3.730000.p3  ORF type:complete len:86 (-),score=52.80 NODE_27053_length_527_cov_3.730000:128-385(-)